MLISHGTPSMECDATYPYSGLCQHALLTNKNNHLKKWEADLPRIAIENWNVYKFIFAKCFRLFTKNKF